MELGELELAVLRAVRNLGPATSGAIYAEVPMRKASEKKVYYRLKEGRAYRKAMASMIDRVVDTFGGAAVSYLLGNPGSASEAQMADLKTQVDKRRTKEKRDA